jgi:hypothetical protein
MQNAALTRPVPSFVSSAPGYGPHPVNLSAQRVDQICSDHQFIALLEAYRRSGGLARGQEMLARVQSCKPGGDVALAEWVVHRKVICFDWQDKMWLPLFQFSKLDMMPLAGLDQVLAELVPKYEPLAVAKWFAQAHPWLANETPADRLPSDLAAVLHAARTEPPFVRH